MKLLTTEQQNELQSLMISLSHCGILDVPLLNQINYWNIELKPKRARRKTETVVDTTVTT